MRHAVAFILAASVATRVPAGAQQIAAPVVETLVGDWRGEGTLLGRPAVFSMRWEWRLGGRFLVLSFRNAQVLNDTEQPVLDAEAFYEPADGDELRGTWFDSRGVTLELRARVTDTALVTAWSGPRERGQTVYRILSDSTLSVTDRVEADGAPRLFATAVYRRDPGRR